MEKDKLNTQILLEIALNQNPEGNIVSILKNAIPVYLKKLGCFAAAVMQRDRLAYIQPKALEKTETWLEASKEINQLLQTADNEIIEIRQGANFYYSYPLADYGWLVLAKKKPLNRSLKLELKKIIYQLGKNIQFAENEETARKDRQKLKSILNELSDVVWSVNMPDYKTIFVTPSAEKLYGIAFDKCMKDSSWWSKAIYEEDRSVIPEIYKQLETKGSANVKYRIQTPTGEIKWVRSKSKVIYNDDGTPIRIDGIFADRTPQYTAQEQLDKEILLQEALIDIASTYINLDLKDVEKTINDSLKKMGEFVRADRSYIFDYNFDTKTTSNTYEWCNTGIEAEIENLQNVPLAFFPQWIEAHEQGEAFYVPDVFSLKDDGEESLRGILEPQGIKSLIAIPMKDGDELIGFVGFDSVRQHHSYTQKEQKLLHLFGQMLINIRNRQKWEKQLRLQEEKYRNIITNMNLGLVEVDIDETILFANQTFRKMSGYSLTQLHGQRMKDLIKPDKKISLKSEKDKTDLIENYEISIKDINNNPRWWFVSEAPNYNDRGQKTGSVFIHLDITDQKNLERELAMAKSQAENAAKSKEIFLANMSHEIRTPLNVIIGMIRELNKQNLGTDQRFYVTQSDSAAKHLLTILNHILDIAKIESGELTLEEKDFSVSAVCSNAFSILHSQALEKNIDFNLSIDKNIYAAHVGDEGRIRQVLINILGNAIKFTHEGSVKFNVNLLEDTDLEQIVRFSVVDTGIGMSAAFMKNLFNKFAQEHSEANRKYEGTGLGMTIAREMILLMGSDIHIESKKGKGTRITFDLPLTKGDSSKLRYTAGQIEKDAYLGKHLLVVEDNDMNRFIALQSLHYFGCIVDEAVNGMEAIEMVRKYDYDLILMDIQMPIMDGHEATLHIRNVLESKTPIVALTANAFRHDIERYIEAGMDNFVTKPFSEDELYAKLRPFLLNTDEKINHTSSVKPLYNLTSLQELSHGDERFTERMLTLFTELASKAIAEFEEAIERKDYRQIANTAHRMKPSIDNLDIVELKHTIRELEKFPIDGNVEERKKLVTSVKDTLEQVCVEIKSR
ncbi:MAG: response regulator [Bacteroidetes bacterium]|nr:response regulator [Bacteroidota bacterium]